LKTILTSGVQLSAGKGKNEKKEKEKGEGFAGCCWAGGLAGLLLRAGPRLLCFPFFVLISFSIFCFGFFAF
jgi:hypothetical protein